MASAAWARSRATTSFHRSQGVSSTRLRSSPNGRPTIIKASRARCATASIRPAEALDPLMPRFVLADDEIADLAAYLQGLSSGTSPGVDDKVIRFATVVTDEVDPEVRDAVLAVLKTFFDEKTRQTRLESERWNRGTTPESILPTLYREWVLDVWTLTGPREGWDEQLEQLSARPGICHAGGIEHRLLEPDWPLLRAPRNSVPVPRDRPAGSRGERFLHAVFFARSRSRGRPDHESPRGASGWQASSRYTARRRLRERRLRCVRHCCKRASRLRTSGSSAGNPCQRPSWLRAWPPRPGLRPFCGCGATSSPLSSSHCRPVASTSPRPCSSAIWMGHGSRRRGRYSWFIPSACPASPIRGCGVLSSGRARAASRSATPGCRPRLSLPVSPPKTRSNKCVATCCGTMRSTRLITPRGSLLYVPIHARPTLGPRQRFLTKGGYVLPGCGWSSRDEGRDLDPALSRSRVYGLIPGSNRELY